MIESVFETILREYSGLVSRIVRTFEANAAARDDLRQEVTLALWRAAPSWRGDHGNGRKYHRQAPLPQ
jgi:RNA polymerase sigma-70 factor (ECF subfamily)